MSNFGCNEILFKHLPHLPSIADLIQCQNDHVQIVHQIAFLDVLSQNLKDRIVEARQYVEQNELKMKTSNVMIHNL